MLPDLFKDDRSLVEGCIRRDPAAWSAFVERYESLITISINGRARMYGFALSREDINDIKQNVLALIWRDRRLEEVKDTGRITHWLAIVSGNAAMEYLRRRRRREGPEPVSLSDGDLGKKLIEDAAPNIIKPDDETLKLELSSKIDEAIGSLPAKEKLVVELSVFYDKKYHEIADILNLPAGTVSSYAKRAKEKLRRKLREYK